MTVKNQTLLLLLLLLWAVRVPSTFAASPGTQTHNTRGLVRELSPDHTKAVIRHEPIPDYMPAMTMEFNVKDTNELAGITVGDTVTFQLTANAETHWISQIRRVGKPSTPIPALVTAPPSTNLPPSVPLVTELKPGDLMPDFTVTDETGKQIQLSYYRGKAVALTFFFTRCPLPDFCPRMATNFAKARHLLLVAPDSRRNWQFLSVSFDPDFDNPPILASYANLYRDGNPDRWIFAMASTPTLAQLAPQLDLIMTKEEGGSISHNLRTVVINPRGRIARQFDGNTWSPADLATALHEAAKPASP